MLHNLGADKQCNWGDSVIELLLKENIHIDGEKRRTYAAMVTSLDDGVGLILDKLVEKNISDNTIVVFFSDNGGVEWYNHSDNGILRGGKGEFFEGGIRVPFVMQWPNVIPAGLTYDKPIIALDIFATAASVLSINLSTKSSTKCPGSS